MVDAEDVPLVEALQEQAIQRPRGLQVVAERLLDDHACAFRRAAGGKLPDNLREQRRRYCKVMRGMLRVAQRAPDGAERVEVRVVAIDVREQLAELLERGRVDASAVLGDAIVRPGAQLLEVPARLRDADHRNVQPPTAHQCLERRKNLLVSQVAGGTKEHERICGVCHRQPVVSIAHDRLSIIDAAVDEAWPVRCHGEKEDRSRRSRR